MLPYALTGAPPRPDTKLVCKTEPLNLSRSVPINTLITIDLLKLALALGVKQLHTSFQKSDLRRDIAGVRNSKLIRTVQRET